MMLKPFITKIPGIFKWSGIAARCAAAGTALCGACAAVMHVSMTVIATLGAAGVTTYTAAKSMTPSGYELTKHISPRPSSGQLPPRTASMMPRSNRNA